MTRRCCVFPAFLLLACSPPAPGRETLLPPTMGSWNRTSLRDVAPPQPGVLRGFEADYQGAGQLTVDLYETRSSGTAFEMTQHWRPAADSVFFDKGRYFALVKWRQADRPALTAFVRAWEKQLGALRE